ncbi:hypothetical protein [Peribacillus loiseleuriae]|uniref:hypothetical protein n=1 Tax=Peribacillus loiseleuriae TaxID=1679170 RepID=UPI000B02785E|nr:hypothetical protein [Peribacillus loiseleuriae]
MKFLIRLKKNGTINVFSTHIMDVAAETGEVIESIKNENEIKETTMKLMKLHRQ